MLHLIGNINHLTLEQYWELYERYIRTGSQVNGIIRAGDNIQDTLDTDKPLKTAEKAYVVSQAVFIGSTMGHVWVSEIVPENYSTTTRRVFRLLQGAAELSTCISEKCEKETGWEMIDYMDVMHIAMCWSQRNPSMVTAALPFSRSTLLKTCKGWSKIYSMCKAADHMRQTWESAHWDKNQLRNYMHIAKDAAIIVTTTGDLWVNDICSDFGDETKKKVPTCFGVHKKNYYKLKWNN